MTDFSSDSDPVHLNKSLNKSPSGLALVSFMGLFMLVGILFLSWLGTPRIEPAEGRSFSKVDLKPIAHAETALSEADLQGKLTLIHFWGTWCPPCRQEFPLFTALAKEFAQDDRVRIVSVSSSQGAEYDLDQLTSETKQFLEQYEASMPTYADPAGLTRAEAGQLLPQGSLPYPSTFLLNRAGQVEAVWLGYSPTGMTEVGKRLRDLLQ